MKQTEFNAFHFGPYQLPFFCYSVLPDTGDLIRIQYGKMGYLISDYNTDCMEENRKLADSLNQKYGVSVCEEEGMVFGSVFGWTCPGCNPKIYEYKHKECL